MAARLLDQGYKRALFVLLAGLLGMAIALLVSAASGGRPSGSWQQLALPPVKLTRLVADIPMAYGEGELYANTADGTLYALPWRDPAGAWSKQDLIASPQAKPAQGLCPEGYTAPEFPSKPKTPGVVVDSYATGYCGPDGGIDVYFVLLEDGSVWVLKLGYLGIAYSFGLLIMACCGLVGLMVGLLAGFVLVRIATRRSRLAP